MLLRWGLLLLWCGLIFWGTGNHHFSGQSTQAVVTQAAQSLGMESARQVEWLNLAIRKSTHVVLFAVLGLLAGRAFSVWPAARSARTAWWAWLFATLYAASDEWHQHFVPGRTASVWDVLLDSAAAAVVLLALHYIVYLVPGKAKPPL